MHLYVAAGDRTAAVRVFHGRCATLERELRVAPSLETRAVYESLLPDRRADGRARGGLDCRLVGRRDERARLGARWRSVKIGELRPGASAVRFVLLHGDPGVGKSRLAEDFGAWCRRRGARVADARRHTVEGPLAYGVVTTWLRADAIRPGVIRMDTARVSESPGWCPRSSSSARTCRRPSSSPRPSSAVGSSTLVATALTSPADPRSWSWTTSTPSTARPAGSALPAARDLRAWRTSPGHRPTRGDGGW